MFKMDSIKVAFYLFAIAIACLVRTMAPFIRKYLEELEKLKDGEITELGLEYDPTYTILFLVSVIISVMASFVIYMENPLLVTGDIPSIIGKGFVLGLSGNWIVVELTKWFLPDKFRG